ncbi:sugar phosphate nucleotidyltransferase [Paenibacillus eucommiae]|uniref:Mannose-1-phosphate guanylyltransferase/phosphomannomutase n=1 Tax=Paenibacillus eucommiae TaxID=1355755 RepID=A0ABS4J188_9BACL|nr:sugar phosphate nucleotidyltransferase [Paenibacillus eucommiae]MBP1993576.1 mannose-1-phosphate guanylyltransferase/phosphomannomutase [Paenibacillus eucommiae]
MKAVIMAGGKGTRLRPLTCHLPKPMVPLLSKPCMAYTIELLRKHGISDIAVTMQYLPEVIRDYFGDGHEFGVNLHYFEEHTPLGTAGSVKHAQHFLDDTFLVISGDSLTDFDLQQAYAFHQNKQSLATLLLTHVSEPLEYGVVMTDEAGRVMRFLEKPSWGEVFSDTVNTGIYILEPDIFGHIPEGSEYDFSQQLFPALLRDKSPLYGCISSGYWSDIGNLQQYRQTQFDMLDGTVNVKIEGKEVRPGIFIGDNVSLSPSIRWTGPAFIGSGTQLEEDVEIGEYCVIGKHNLLAKGSVLSRSVLWDHNHFAGRSELSGSTVTSRTICKGTAFLGEGSVIGNRVTIGTGSMILPHVKIWPDKQIRENSRLSSSLIWGDHASKSLFKTSGVCGIPNVEMTPEFAARFGTAYGAALAPSRSITVSSSPYAFTRLLKQTVIASLQSVGTHVIDLGDLSAPAAQFAVRHLQTEGGIHISWSGNELEACLLECYDDTGMPIAKSKERKVENSYWQEDYSRASMRQLGHASIEPHMMSSYMDSLIEELDDEVIQGKDEAAPETELDRKLGERLAPNMSSFRIIVEVSPWLGKHAAPLWKAMNCEYIEVSPASLQEPLTLFVAKSRAKMGIKLEGNGRNLQLLTEQGDVVEGDRLKLLVYVCYFHSCPGSVIGAPGSMPHVLESLAEGLGCQVIRTKELNRSIYEASHTNLLHPLMDTLFAASLVIRHLQRTRLELSELLALLPDFHVHSERVDCPWDFKGKVMRSLVEQTGKSQIELLDGIKIYEDKGWVLLLPDDDHPEFNIIAQAASGEEAQALIGQYREQILNALQ